MTRETRTRDDSPRLIGVTLVATLTVRSDQAAVYDAVERHAAVVMARHGGRIERVVRLPTVGDTFQEVHVVTFPDTAALAAYRADPATVSAAAMREASVVATETLVGTDGADYDASSPPRADAPGGPELRVSLDRSELDVPLVHTWLSGEAYWSRGISEAVVRRAIAGSLCAGAYRDGQQVGFARMVTDRATFAWLCDVFVAEPERGRGVSKALVAALVSHPDVEGVRRAMLATADAHGLYAQYGFEPVARPETYMERIHPAPYGPVTP